MQNFWKVGLFFLLSLMIFDGKGQADDELSLDEENAVDDSSVEESAVEDDLSLEDDVPAEITVTDDDITEKDSFDSSFEEDDDLNVDVREEKKPETALKIKQPTASSTVVATNVAPPSAGESAQISSQMIPKSGPEILEFSGANLRDVVKTLSNENKVNFILPESLANQKVYMTLRNVGWKDALKAVLEAYSLGMIELEGGVIRIDSLSMIEKERTDTGKVKIQEILQMPTQVRVMRLSYSKAQEIVKIVQSLLTSSSFDKRVKVEVDQRTNSLIVEATEHDLKKIETLIHVLDLETPQVKIETRVIEVLKNIDQFLGINWSMPFNYDQGRGLGFGNLIFPNYILSAFSVDTGARKHDTGGQGDVHIGSLNNVTNIDARVRMTEDSKLSRNLQNNSVLVLDHEPARIEVGLEQYYPSEATDSSGKRSTTLASVKYILALDVTPHITADQSVNMALNIEHSSPVGTSTGIPPNKQLRTVKTSMLRKSGETAVIGGLYTTEVSKQRNGMPFLSKIPLVGFLFQSSGLIDNRRELIIMVTPTVVSSAAERPFSLEDSAKFQRKRLTEIDDLEIEELRSWLLRQKHRDSKVREVPKSHLSIEGDAGEKPKQKVEI
jgi:type IV pilus assembly protein PilQ